MEKKEYSTQNRKMSLGQAMRAHIDYVPSKGSYPTGFTMYPIKCNPSEDGKELLCTLNIRGRIGDKGVSKMVEFSNDAIAPVSTKVDFGKSAL